MTREPGDLPVAYINTIPLRGRGEVYGTGHAFFSVVFYFV
jgi:hypothetical protein